MADKPEFVDLISDATRQMRRNVSRVVDLDPVAPKEASRLGHRSERLQAWRMETFTPWKLKSWKFKNLDLVDAGILALTTQLSRHAGSCRGHPRSWTARRKTWMAGSSPAMTK